VPGPGGSGCRWKREHRHGPHAAARCSPALPSSFLGAERRAYPKLRFPLITARGKIIGKPCAVIAGGATPPESTNEALARGSLVRRGGRWRAPAAGGSRVFAQEPREVGVFVGAFIPAVIRNTWLARSLRANGFRVTGTGTNPASRCRSARRGEVIPAGSGFREKSLPLSLSLI